MGLIKLAGLADGVGKGLLTAGKYLMENKVLRNAAVGAGVGAISGAISAPEGQGLKGALKGAAGGGLLAGGATYGGQVYNNFKSAKAIAPDLGTSKLVSQAFKTTGDAGIGNAMKNSVNLFKQQTSLAQGKLPSLPTIGG
jgi:hypothetical protein